MSGSILIKNVQMLSEYGFGKENVSVGIIDGIIEYVGTSPDVSAYSEIVDGKGNLLIPAFYNTHSHVAMSLFRGYGEDLPLERWLNDKIFPAEDRLTDKAVYVGSMLSIAEMIANGVVSFSDMYMFEQETARAVIESGIKANLSRCIVSFSDVDSPSLDKRFVEAVKLVNDFNGAADGRLKIDMSLHAEYTNTEQMCRLVGDYCRENDLGIQIHVSETSKEHEEAMVRRNGRTPIQFFNDIGLLDNHVVAAHCVWVSDEDIEIMRDKRVNVSHNAVSNLKLGSGVMPLQKMLNRGINVSLGTDGSASNNNLDIIKELQYASLIHKGVNYMPEATKAESMFKMATINAARAQRRDDCGEIKVKNKADLVLIDIDSVNNIPSYDYYTTMVYSAKSSDVLLTMVDGVILYQNGEYKTIDIEKVKHEAKDVVNHYFD